MSKHLTDHPPEHITKHYDLEERRATMPTQWGVITVEKWLYLEARRLKAAGARAKVGTDRFEKRKWIEMASA